MTERPSSSDLEALETVCQNATRLLNGLADPPRAVRLRAGDLAVEVEFQQGSAPVEQLASDGAGADADDADDCLHYINAPLVGVFYRSPEPGADPFVREGDLIEVGQQVAIIEAMKVMMPIKAECAGDVRKILVADGASVEYDEHLIAVERRES